MHTDQDVAIALFNAHTSTHTADAGRDQGNGVVKSVKMTGPQNSQGGSRNSGKSPQALWRLRRDVADLSEAESGLWKLHKNRTDLSEAKRGLWRLHKNDADLSEAECGSELMYRCNEELKAQLPRVNPSIKATREPKLKCAGKRYKKGGESGDLIDMTVKHALVHGLADTEIR